MTRRVLVACVAVALAGTVAGCRGPAPSVSGPQAERQVQQFESTLRGIERELDADPG
ncbi:MAG: hypothetical protein AB7J32_21930 [Pseudonocardia sp.]